MREVKLTRRSNNELQACLLYVVLTNYLGRQLECVMQEHSVSSAGIVDRQTENFQGYDKSISGIEVLSFLLSLLAGFFSLSSNTLYSVSYKLHTYVYIALLIYIYAVFGGNQIYISGTIANLLNAVPKLNLGL
jgi:hypothetical protein